MNFKILILLTSFIGLVSFATTEPSLSERIKNNQFYSLDSKLWDFFEDIRFDDIIKGDKWNSSLNFKRSVIDYQNNKGVLIDTTSLPITWNVLSKDIKSILPRNLPSNISASLNYNLNFGLITQRVLVIPKKEEFDKQAKKDWIKEVHKELLKTLHTSPEGLRKSIKKHFFNAEAAAGLPDDLNISPIPAGKINRDSWKKRASDRLIKKWNTFLYQLRFDFNTVQYEHFFSRFLNIFKLPIRASIAKKLSMRETISYTAYGVHSLGPSFSIKKLNLNINISPYYIIRNGRFKVQVLRLDPLDPHKVLLKFSHLTSTGSGSSLGIKDSSYLVKKVTDALPLSSGNFFKKVFLYQITPIINFKKSHKNLSIEEKTQTYEFDLSHSAAVEAYNYAAIGMTHKTEAIIKKLQHLGQKSPVKIRQRDVLKSKQYSKTSELDILGSTYTSEKNCFKQLDKTTYTFYKEKKQFLNFEGSVSCNNQSTFGLFRLFNQYKQKKYHYISGGVLTELNTLPLKKELYLNAIYSSSHNTEYNNASYYQDVKSQLEYFNLISNEPIQLPCPEYKIQEKEFFNSQNNWNNTELLDHNREVDQCVKDNLQNIKIQFKIYFSKEDVKKFYSKDKLFILKAIQVAFKKYIDSSIVHDIENAMYLTQEELEKKLTQYKTNANQRQYTFVNDILSKKYNVIQKLLIQGIQLSLLGLERIGLPYSKELRLESAIKKLFTSWETIKTLSQVQKINTEKIVKSFYAMFNYPEFSKEYIHFISIISEGKTFRSIYLKQDGTTLLNK